MFDTKWDGAMNHFIKPKKKEHSMFKKQIQKFLGITELHRKLDGMDNDIVAIINNQLGGVKLEKPKKKAIKK